MNERIIKIRSYTDVESLKKDILQKLNLIDHKKDCIQEFYIRLLNYLGRNQSLKITIQCNRDQLAKDLRSRLLAKRFESPMPDNYETGNPLNRWFFDSIRKTEEELEREQREFEKAHQVKLQELTQFLKELEQIGNGQIAIKD